MAWFRRRKEQRSIDSVPWDTGAPLQVPVSQARALTLAPVYAANRHIADNISTLPLQTYRRDGARRLPAPMPELFRTLADDGELNDWLYTSLTSLALRGNSVGLITGRDDMEFANVVTWVPMDDIHVDDQNYPNSVWYYRGRRINRDELVHIPWFKIAGRTLGLSPIEAYALTVTSGLEAQRFGTGWFESGGVPPGTFKNSRQTVDSNEADVIRSRLVASIRSHRPLVYGADWDYNALTVPPEQAQFIETMNLTANQIAAIYGIAPEEIGGQAANSLTYTNEEHRHLRRMADLRPWFRKLEDKFSSWIPGRVFVRFNADAPIRVDLKTRHEVYHLDRVMGFANIDELRALDDLPPLPDGAGQNYTPLGTVAPPPVARTIPGEPLIHPVNGNQPAPVRSSVHV